MKRARPLRPATHQRAAASLALVIAAIPLFPSPARADATVPGDRGKPGDAKPRPQPPERIVPPPPGGMPPPHVVIPPDPPPSPPKGKPKSSTEETEEERS